MALVAFSQKRGGGGGPCLKKPRTNNSCAGGEEESNTALHWNRGRQVRQKLVQKMEGSSLLTGLRQGVPHRHAAEDLGKPEELLGVQQRNQAEPTEGAGPGGVVNTERPSKCALPTPTCSHPSRGGRGCACRPVTNEQSRWLTRLVKRPEPRSHNSTSLQQTVPCPGSGHGATTTTHFTTNPASLSLELTPVKMGPTTAITS